MFNCDTQTRVRSRDCKGRVQLSMSLTEHADVAVCQRTKWLIESQCLEEGFG